MGNFRTGIDENGLGPRLGPLVVTAVLARVDEQGSKLASKKARGKLKERLGDSKGLMSHGNIATGEAWARAIAGRMGLSPRGPDDLFHALSLDSRDHLTSPCPSHVGPQCWNAHDEAFEAEPDLVDTVRQDLETLARKGLTILEVRTTITCTKKLNEARLAGLSRFDVDLHSMERLVLGFHERTGGDNLAICGKVGGYARYSSAFGPLAGRLHAIIEEGARRSAYRFPGIGEIAFVRDADENDLLVSMASLVGKWVREVMMSRIVRYYRGHDSEVGGASGYHDPVTTRFVRATALLRREHRIPDQCFQRASDISTQSAAVIEG